MGMGKHGTELSGISSLNVAEQQTGEVVHILITPKVWRELRKDLCKAYIGSWSGAFLQMLEPAMGEAGEGTKGINII